MGLISKFKKFRTQNGAIKKEGKKSEEEMTFLEHLEDLRWHIMRSLVAIAVVGIVIFIYRVEVIEGIILAPMDGDFPMHRFICWFQQSVLNRADVVCFDQINVDIQIISPYEGFLKAITIAFIGGFVVSFPYVLWEVWRFIKPGLHPHERKGLRGNVLIMSLLFFMGISFGYFVITPFSVQFLASFKLTSGVDEVVSNKTVVSDPSADLPVGLLELNGTRLADGTIDISGSIKNSSTQKAIGALSLKGKMPTEGEVQLNGTIQLDILGLQQTKEETVKSTQKSGTVIENNWRIGNVIGLITQIVLAAGILFQLPIMVFYLTKMGLLSPELMRKYRRHAIVGILVIAAIITPPDPLSQIMLFFPLFILYEISLKICKTVYKKEEEKLA